MDKEKVTEEFLNKITERAEHMTSDRFLREEYIKKCIQLFIYELDEDEQVWVVDMLFKQQSYKRLVEHPEFMMNQNKIYSRSIITISVSVGLLLILSAILFSDSPFISWFVGFLKKLSFFVG